jgi:hypothetical protein
MGARRPNPRLAKIHRNYSVAQIAEMYGVHRNTVRRWLKSGLARIEGKGQPIVLGTELRRFHQERRQKAKRPCPPGFMYCFGCRVPRESVGKVADLIRMNATSGNLRGLCPHCGSLMHRRVTLAKLDAVCGRLDITEKEG